MQRVSFFRRLILPLLTLGLIAIFTTAFYLFNLNMEAIARQGNTEAEELTYLLDMAKSLVQERVTSSMELLKLNGASLGAPHINGETILNGEVIPNLIMGFTPVTQKFDLVDNVTNIGSGTATIFVKNQDTFVRVTTNVKQKDNTRATGTRLNPNGDVIKKLQQGLPFYGVVDILGEPYITGYEPIFDNKKAIIGAWYVGYKVDVKALENAIKNWNYLDTGFAAITDYNNTIRFVSERTNKKRAYNIIYGNLNDWTLLEKNIPDWGFHAYIAYPKKEAYLSSISKLYPILIAAGVFGIVLLFLILGSIRKFVLLPLGGEPDTARSLVRKIARGDFNEDETYAAPDTLIDNILKMRKRLREMVSEIKENADRLSISSSVFAHAHDGIFITDSKARIIEINPSFSIVTGYTREEAIGKTPDTLGFAYETEDFFSQFFESTDFQGEWRGETWNQNKAGEKYPVWLDIFPVHTDTGEFRHYVGLFSDISGAKEQQEMLEHYAYHDSLTQLPNRMLFTERLQKALGKSSTIKRKKTFAICYLDLDNFKPINDNYGHEVGDQLLCLLASRLRNCLSKKDTVARLGGDEFALLLEGGRNFRDYTNILDRLLTEIEKPIIIQGHTFIISASIGYTVYPDDNNTSDTLLRHADHAMYQAKTHGGRQYHLFDPQLALLSRNQHQIEEEVANALKNDEFELYFQPQIELKSGEVIGMEALIRWQHPVQGLLLPGDFLPSVEHTSLIADIGKWVVQEALSQINLWNKAGIHIYGAVNIAAYHLTEDGFASDLSKALDQFPAVEGKQLNLEVTESAAINDINNVIDIINHCKKLGVTFAIDDFGAGYSSLIYLRKLPVETIKIDRSFVHNMLNDSENLAVVSSVITLCKEFKRNVIAEGVETTAEANKLAELGCQYIQGFGIAKPMPKDQVIPWIKANTPFEFHETKPAPAHV